MTQVPEGRGVPVKVSYRDVRAGYSDAKAQQERLDVMFRWFARPLSFPVAWVFLRWAWRPNSVTFLSLGGNVLGLALMVSGVRLWMMIGVVILLLALILGAADGNMARATRTFSPLGEWLEGVGAYVLYACYHFAGGLGAARSTSTVVPVVQAAWATPSRLIALGAGASISITLAVLVAAKFSLTFPQIERESVVAKRGGGLYGALFTVGKNLSFPSGLVLPVTLIAIAVRRYEYLLIFFALANACMLVALLTRCLSLALRVSTTPES